LIKSLIIEISPFSAARQQADLSLASVCPPVCSWICQSSPPM